MNSKLDYLKARLQGLLPQHTLSRWAGQLTDAHTPWLKNFLIRQSIKRFNIDLSDALEENPENHACFNDFFTRALKPGARPLDDHIKHVISPADGVLSQAGKIDDKRIIQAKGRDFSIEALLGESAHPFKNGMFATIYLSPRDYHRVHMPVAGTLRETHYIPGKLFSVNAMTAQHVDQLFAKNERLVCWFDTEFGDMALILVGAMLVAGIESVWHGHYAPRAEASESFDTADSVGPRFDRGEEMGRFKFGSTVIMLLPPGAYLSDKAQAGQAITMGSTLAEIR